MKARRAQTGLERRDIDGAAATVDDSGKIRGTAIVFDTWTTIGSGPKSFRERVAPGAVKKTLAEGDVIYLDNHDTAKPLARVSAGNLDIRADGKAVHYLADPSDTSYARDLKANIRAKNVRGNSFGFEVVKDEWAIGDDGVDERTLREIKLPEISACTFPAYEQTEIGMRDAYEAAMECRDRFYAKSGDGTRAAKATYADVNTCGLCGSTSQYSSYCTSCGGAMGSTESTDTYCGSCGAQMSQGRAAHECEVRANKEPYGDVEYADPGYQSDKKKRYPLNNSDHIHAAWSYINKAKNAAKYTASQLASIKAKIKAAAKKIGMKIAEQNSAELDIDLRNYDPERGFVTETETRDDPDGKEVAAMQAALTALGQGDADAARQALEDALAGDEDGEDDDTEENAEGAGLVAHTEQGGAAVELMRAAVNEAYEAVRDLPPTSRTNKILEILEPHLRTPEPEKRGDPKPDSSTSEKQPEPVEALSDVGVELQKRWLDTQRQYRAVSTRK